MERTNLWCGITWHTVIDLWFIDDQCKLYVLKACGRSVFIYHFHIHFQIGGVKKCVGPILTKSELHKRVKNSCCPDGIGCNKQAKLHHQEIGTWK